jgi:bisphosphoglycerate-independent phosphoglycerate mutase (AlkP superfamily)
LVLKIEKERKIVSLFYDYDYDEKFLRRNEEEENESVTRKRRRMTGRRKGRIMPTGSGIYPHATAPGRRRGRPGAAYRKSAFHRSSTRDPWRKGPTSRRGRTVWSYRRSGAGRRFGYGDDRFGDHSSGTFLTGRFRRRGIGAPKKNRPFALIILDGFGVSNKKLGNAVEKAKMPAWRTFIESYPYTELGAAGRFVGLPEGFAGNSEVGHLTIGAGRTVKSILERFFEAIETGQLENHPVISENFKKIAENGKRLHLFGLLSDGGVHCHIKIFESVLKIAKKFELKESIIHVVTDGRDVGERTAVQFLDRLGELIRAENFGKVGSVHGRFYAMDRDNNWERTEKSFRVLFCPDSDLSSLTSSESSDDQHCLEAAKNYISTQYDNGVTDQFIEPTRIAKDAVIEEGDGLFFLNFRPDRMRQLTAAVIEPQFNAFDRSCHGKDPADNAPSSKLSFFLSSVLYKDEFSEYGNESVFNERKIKVKRLGNELGFFSIFFNGEVHENKCCPRIFIIIFFIFF